MMNSISRIGNTSKMDLALVLALTISPVMHFIHAAKSVLFVAKRVADLQTTHNKSVTTQRSSSAINILSTKVAKVMIAAFNSILPTMKATKMILTMWFTFLKNC